MSDEAAQIVVEFFGIARARTNVPHVALSVESAGTSLAEVWNDLVARFPNLADGSADLEANYLVNLDGQRFVSGPTTRIPPGSHVLILSPDAGG